MKQRFATNTTTPAELSEVQSRVSSAPSRKSVVIRMGPGSGISSFEHTSSSEDEDMPFQCAATQTLPWDESSISMAAHPDSTLVDTPSPFQ